MTDILRKVAEFGATFVCVTGGEPLAQPGCIALLAALCDAQYKVSLETSGALDIAAVDPRVKRIVDFKTPSSGELEKNLLENIARLAPHDEVKFVIGSREDYEWSRKFCSEHKLRDRVAALLFSPVMEVEGCALQQSPRELAEWILHDRLPVRMQLQQHKLIWGDQPGH